TDINAITISNIAGIVEPNAPVFVKNFPNAIPRVLTKDNSQNIIPKIDANSLVSISAIIFALSGAETTANFITEMDNAKKNF
ncbi:hypothetical protein ACTPEF_27415, partial [Clostridioides difficile]